MFGILALTVTSGALHVVMPEPTAHLLGSLTFGIGFVTIARFVEMRGEPERQPAS